MFTRKTPVEKTGLEIAIDDILSQMAHLTSADSDEYAKMTKQLKVLYKLKDVDRPSRVSPDTLALILGNVGVTLLIVGHERANVIGTKALSFLQKAR